MLAIARPHWQALMVWFERRLPALTRYRQAEALPIALHRRRIYVLPTGFGLLFGSMLVVMLLGALNFNNNAALLLTFALSGAVVLSMSRGVVMLDGVRLAQVRATPVHAGDPLRIECLFEHDSAEPREQLLLERDQQRLGFDLRDGRHALSLGLAPMRRGLQPVGRLTLSSSFPFGLFRAWSVLNPDTSIWIYPTPEARGPAPLPGGSGLASARPQRGDDEWFALREYRHGDPKRLIAWRASARSERLMVKELVQETGAEYQLDWDATRGLAHEARISRLTRWVLDASAAGARFALHLPNETIGPGKDPAHTRRCLQALSLLP
jgi:uncharacterized protein (DUF58 family)